MADLGRRDAEALKKWFTEKSVLWMPPAPPIEGERRILVAFRVIFRAYTDLNWSVKEVYSVGNNRFIYMTDSWGTIGRDMPYKNNILTVIDFDADGRIVYLSDYFKDTAIFHAEKKTALNA